MASTATICCDGGHWTAYVSIEGAVSVFGLDDDGEGGLFGSSTTTGVTEFTVEYPCPGALEPAEYTLVRNSCGCDFAIFGVGNRAVCTSLAGVTFGGCANLARFRVDMVCCDPLEPGYYCARPAGSMGAYVAVLITAEDACNPNIEVDVGGPYATLELAQAECPSVSGLVCCPDAEPETLNLVFEILSGPCDCLAGTGTMTYLADRGAWWGYVATTCTGGTYLHFLLHSGCFTTIAYSESADFPPGFDDGILCHGSTYLTGGCDPLVLTGTDHFAFSSCGAAVSCTGEFRITIYE